MSDTIAETTITQTFETVVPTQAVVPTQTVETVVPTQPVVDAVTETVEEPLPVVPTPPVTPTPSLQEREDRFNADIEAKTIVETLAESMETFNVEKLMEVLPQLMKHVQVYKNLNGEQKKKLVIKMINHLVDITDSPGDDAIWDPILKRMVPSIIDTLVKVDQKKLVLRKKPKCLSKVFACM